MKMKQRRLIINADDFGMSRGISEGILTAHAQGVVTSTTLMANQPASEYAVAQWQKSTRLGVGVHLNLCEGRPVLPPEQVPSLVTPDGAFHAPEQMIERLWHGRVLSREIEAEFRAQIRWVKDHGITPTHADSHHHMHNYPYAATAFCRALQQENITRARTPRVRHWPRKWYAGGPHAGPLYRRLLVTAYMEVLRFGVFNKLICPDFSVVGHPRFRQQVSMLSKGWMLALEHLPPGNYEMVCHPGYRETGFSERDGIADRRELELHILTDSDFSSLIKREQIELITYAQIGPQYARDLSPQPA
jgi:predicted glycoside hydrolase/deacetylase ChbG (UPF0249 family)